MKLNSDDVKLFYKLNWALLFYTNQKYPVIKNLKEPDFKNKPPADIKNLFEKLISHRELIDSFVYQNPFNFTEEELEIIKSWKNYVKSDFWVMAYLRDYTVFWKNSGEQKVYGVLGLQDNIRNVIPRALPQYVETIFLPFRGKIIYCGFINGYNVQIEGNLQIGLQEEYKKARRQHNIITSLDDAS
jgi:hypothetical protein